MRHGRSPTVKQVLFLIIAIVFLGGFCVQVISESGSFNFKGDDGIQSGTVFVLENDIYQPYLIVDYDSGNYCLLRKNLLEQQMVFNDAERYTSYYANSMIDQYLNGPFLESLGAAVRDGIVESQITIVADNSIGICGNETETILRRVFLPSRMEITGYSTKMSPPEGRQFPYLKEEQRLTSNLDGTHCIWWLRSPNTWYDNALFIITQDGSTNYVSTTGISGDTVLGVRPAFWVSASVLTADHDGNYYIQ